MTHITPVVSRTIKPGRVEVAPRCATLHITKVYKTLDGKTYVYAGFGNAADKVTTQYFDADTLRATAGIFSQLAQVLEENEPSKYARELAFEQL